MAKILAALFLCALVCMVFANEVDPTTDVESDAAEEAQCIARGNKVCSTLFGTIY